MARHEKFGIIKFSITLLLISGGLAGQWGCEQAPKRQGIYLIRKGYQPLEKVTIEEKSSTPEENTIVRHYSINPNLPGAITIEKGEHHFYIRLPAAIKDFKLLKVKGPKIIRYKYFKFKPKVEFNFVPGRLRHFETFMIMETKLKPGKYLIVPWEKYLPYENYGYGFKVK